MLNLAFIIYLLIMAIFVGGVLAVVYHLYFYRMNGGFSAFIIVLFFLVSVFLFYLSVSVADKVNWDDFSVPLPF